jgi:ribA/ribD-fused uncharacterized protein
MKTDIKISKKENVCITKDDSETFWLHNSSYHFIGEFKTAEHFFMYKKALLFGDLEAAEKVKACSTADETNNVVISGYDPVVWDLKKWELMYETVKEKVAYSPELVERLLATGDLNIVECVVKYRNNKIYQKDSENVLGKTWMRVRDELRIQT